MTIRVVYYDTEKVLILIDISVTFFYVNIQLIFVPAVKLVWKLFWNGIVFVFEFKKILKVWKQMFPILSSQ